ncbi:MAG TPA: hypothetical protein VEQ60_07580 [Longimicrobium sp.]|nr:hypothetical protein [Longimicrobium sp.]
MIRIPTLRTAAAGLSCALLAACGGGGDGGPPFAARDSAGVRIAESRAAAWAPGEEWTVGATPLADVAVGRAPSLAVRLGDGRIAVTGDDERSVRFFGADGVPGTVARPADWPETITWVGVGPGDSLLVWQPRRLSVFTPAGALAREVRPPELEYLEPRMLGRLANGTLLVTAGHQDPHDPARPRRDLITHLWVGAEGGLLGRFADLPDVQRVSVYESGAYEVPFSTRTLVAVSGDEVLVGDNATFEFAAFGPDGELKRVVRRAWEPLPVTPADVEAHHARLDPDAAGYTGEDLATFHRLRAARREQLRHADTFPAFTALLAGADGTVWAEEPRHLHDYWPRWSVFDAQGRWLGTVKMPSGFTLQQAGKDWVLGMEPDTRGVLHARVYPLTRPAAP